MFDFRLVRKLSNKSGFEIIWWAHVKGFHTQRCLQRKNKTGHLKWIPLNRNHLIFSSPICSTDHSLFSLLLLSFSPAPFSLYCLLLIFFYNYTVHVNYIFCAVNWWYIWVMYPKAMKSINVSELMFVTCTVQKNFSKYDY